MKQLVEFGCWSVLLGALGCAGGDGAPTRGPSLGGNGGHAGMSECFERPIRSGELGAACTGDVCNSELVCLEESSATVGGPNDPILAFPGGEEGSFPLVDLPAGYCSLALEASPQTCTSEDEAACNAICGSCSPFFADADVCLRQCRTEIDGNGTCRDAESGAAGYRCDLLFEVCDTGCASDDECRVSREDTDGSGEIESYDPVSMTGDRLVYDAASTFVCNRQTYRCEHPGVVGAAAGIACENDQDCEARGICLDEASFAFPGGYCSKLRCDLEGNPCADDGVCAEVGFGSPVCAEPCNVGAGAVEGDVRTYLATRQGCRDEYTCFWNGVAGDARGACVPGVYNDVQTPNIGEACGDNGTCYSPFGQGVCGDEELTCSILDAPAGETCPVGFGCAVLDCAAPGIPADVCGSDALCVLFASGLSLCLEACVDADDCLPGAACFDVDEDPATVDSVCFPFCLDDDECRSGEVCNLQGNCVSGA